jgi:hypothetical protein
MRERYLVMLIPVLLLALVETSYAWQGRMGGMNDPFGLVADESDYLIHPAKIAKGEGVRFYGDYRFTYTGMTKWDDRFNDLVDVSGKELRHNALVGAAFPLGPGRMGLFFTYEGMRGSYDGNSDPFILTIKNNLDNFAGRVMYGLPVGGSFKLGAEAQLAYRRELQRVDDANGNLLFLNDWWSPYPFPNDSKYLEALFKGSLDGKVGLFDVELTVRGGFIVPGTTSSDWDYRELIGGTAVDAWNASGTVHGWQVGGDLWLRYPLAPDLTLPVLVRADYRHKTRDGSGLELAGPISIDFQGEATNLAITVGGGLDKKISKATRIAGGIYYNFLRQEEDFTTTESIVILSIREGLSYPHSMEHQILFRLAGEHTFSPTVTLRAGLNAFYGWVIPELTDNFMVSFLGVPVIVDNTHEGPGHGYDWGLLASLGGTVKVKPVTLEPFVGAGYRQFHIGMADPPLRETISRNEWLITTGLSILYDL